MELKLECRRCRYSERADPADAQWYVGISRKLHTAEPDFALERCADGLQCPICGAHDFKVDAIRPLKGRDPDEG
jgi:hypothetical protein